MVIYLYLKPKTKITEFTESGNNYKQAGKGITQQAPIESIETVQSTS